MESMNTPDGKTYFCFVPGTPSTALPSPYRSALGDTPVAGGAVGGGTTTQRSVTSARSEASGATGTTAAVEAVMDAALDYVDDAYEDEFEEEEEGAVDTDGDRQLSVDARAQSAGGRSESSSLQRTRVDELVESLVEEVAPGGGGQAAGAAADVDAAAAVVSSSTVEMEAEAEAGSEYDGAVWRREQQVTAAVLALPAEGWGPTEVREEQSEEQSERDFEVGERAPSAASAGGSARAETAASETDERVAGLEAQLAAAHAALSYTTALEEKATRLEAAAAAASSREAAGLTAEEKGSDGEAAAAEESIWGGPPRSITVQRVRVASAGVAAGVAATAPAAEGKEEDGVLPRCSAAAWRTRLRLADARLAYKDAHIAHLEAELREQRGLSRSTTTGGAEAIASRQQRGQAEPDSVGDFDAGGGHPLRFSALGQAMSELRQSFGNNPLKQSYAPPDDGEEQQPLEEEEEGSGDHFVAPVDVVAATALLDEQAAELRLARKAKSAAEAEAAAARGAMREDRAAMGAALGAARSHLTLLELEMHRVHLLVRRFLFLVGFLRLGRAPSARVRAFSRSPTRSQSYTGPPPSVHRSVGFALGACACHVRCDRYKRRDVDVTPTYSQLR